MDFCDFALKLKLILIKNIDNPFLAGFKKNTKGIFQKIVTAPLIIKDGENLQESGTVNVYYAEQNPNGTSKEAQLVRSGIWKKYEVGWLWLWLNNKRIWLAKVNPDEKKNLSSGWFTTKGELILSSKDLS